MSTFPVYWADWIDASAEYPDTKVLTLTTGFERDYYMVPYGSCDPEINDSYCTSGDPMFIVMDPNDDTFPDKKVITGVKFDDYRIALDPVLIKSEKVYNFKIGNADAVAFYDENPDIVRVYRIPSNPHLEFNYDGVKITDSNGTVWEITGISENGDLL